MIYLLHFDRPYRHARHYLGFAETEATLRKRLDDHLTGNGARLLEVITAEGIGFQVACIRTGDRNEERRLKTAAHVSRWCPLCRKEQS